jgi:hypothetical protein
MPHYHELNDANGDLANVIPFCSDACHQDWHRPVHHRKYEGWNGAHDGADYTEYCGQCGVVASAGEDSCEHQRENVIVNRFRTPDGEMCGHGNWIQLPQKMIGKS